MKTTHLTAVIVERKAGFDKFEKEQVIELSGFFSTPRRITGKSNKVLFSISAYESPIFFLWGGQHLRPGIVPYYLI